MGVEVLRKIDITQFQDDLLTWYNRNKRDLPWRNDQDPYKIWVSEIMLQQTQVDTVIPYFERFLHKFPTPHALANATEQEVLKEWEGLGYYSRARNLQEAVREVVANYDGKVPDDPKSLGSLKGIGPYTQGAILSIAFNQPEPAVDGNVLRVLSRLLDISDNISENRVKKDFQRYARELISIEDPASFNQAVMELGALICTPKQPMCMLCPIREHCQAFKAGTQTDLPVKKKPKKQRDIPYVVLMIRAPHNRIIIEKRPDTGLLANLWQFPMVPIDEVGEAHIENWFYSEYGIKLNVHDKKGTLRHVFSHIVWDLDIYDACTKYNKSVDERLAFVNSDDISHYPFPVSHQKMMKYL
ncbi:MAG TPA: A/G-specific adenine glycosylase [Bacillota bacterium]|nr:A/G-specific adenine glycosylase [Bacillota bacterium]